MAETEDKPAAPAAPTTTATTDRAPKPEAKDTTVVADRVQPEIAQAAWSETSGLGQASWTNASYLAGLTKNVKELAGIDPTTGKFSANPQEIYKIKNSVENPVALTATGTFTGDGQPGFTGDGAPTTTGKPGEKRAVAADGKIDIPAKKPEGMTDTAWEAMRTQAAALETHIKDPKNGLTPEQKADLETSAEQLINGKNKDGSDRVPPLDPAEVTKVLEQANRMFDKTQDILNTGFDKTDRNLGVAAMVHSVANPQDYNQGANNACNVTSAERVEMLTKPGAQAERFVDMYVGANKDEKGRLYVNVPDASNPNAPPQRVLYDVASLKADSEARYAGDNPESGYRNAYARGNNHLDANTEGQPKGWFYTDRGKPEFEKDTGERVRMGSFASTDVLTRKDGSIENSPAMTNEDVQNLLNKKGAGHVAADYEAWSIGKHQKNNGVLRVDASKPGSLDEAWAANGGKPMVIAVNTNAKMFANPGEVGGLNKEGGGGHDMVLSAQRINPATGKSEYYVMNWGPNHALNGWMSGEALQSATNPKKGDTSGNIPAAGTAGAGENPSNWQEKVAHLKGPAVASGGAGAGGDGGGGGSGNDSGQGSGSARPNASTPATKLEDQKGTLSAEERDQFKFKNELEALKKTRELIQKEEQEKQKEIDRKRREQEDLDPNSEKNRNKKRRPGTPGSNG